MEGRRSVRCRAPHETRVCSVVGMLSILAALNGILPEGGRLPCKFELIHGSGCQRLDLAFAGPGVRAAVVGSRHCLTNLLAAESDKDPLGRGKVRYVVSDEDQEENKDLPVYIVVACGLVALAGGAVLLSQGAETPLFVLVVLLTAISGGIAVAIGGLLLVTKTTSPPEEEAAEPQEAV